MEEKHKVHDRSRRSEEAQQYIVDEPQMDSGGEIEIGQQRYLGIYE